MRELTSMEVEVVGGGMCENMGASQCITGVGRQVVREVHGFFSSLNSMGSSLGSWAYDVVNC